MLIQRVITALVLIPPLLGLVWYAPTGAVYGVFAAAGLLMAWEWTGLMNLAARVLRLAFVAVVGLALVAGWFSPLRNAWLPGLLALACL